ncbi:MAG: sulfatase-like hydrolase/transferase, partial [Thermoanaerobaculia bacterium]
MAVLRALRALCLAGLVLAAGPGCRSEPSAPAEPPAPAEPHRRVILLLLDAARPDRFACYGYPRVTTPEIDLLAARGVVFERHYAQGTGTRESVPALLYSRYFSVPIFPRDPQVPYSRPEDLFRRPDDEQISLPAAFEQAGFLTAAISAHLWTGRETPFAAEFMEMHDLTVGHQSRQYPYPRARQVIDFTIGWLRQNRDRDVFLYVHL